MSYVRPLFLSIVQMYDVGYVVAHWVELPTYQHHLLGAEKQGSENLASIQRFIITIPMKTVINEGIQYTPFSDMPYQHQLLRPSRPF